MPPLAARPDNASKKRKQALNSSQSTGQSRERFKRARRDEARTVATQTTDAAFKNGELDVEKFVRARDFEIRALEDGMQTSKQALRVRAFQSVPRDLRRRTASHDVKRIPRRLRARAKREILQDNTVTGQARKKKLSSQTHLRLDTIARLKKLSAKNKSKDSPKSDEHAERGTPIKQKIPHIKKNALHKPPRPKARFRKRQIYKSWLPTHIFHAKRAHMTPPKEPLWCMAIPLTPTDKSYRATHRASGTRGAVAWDMSYMSTIGLYGPIKSMQAVFKALGIGTTSETFWSSKSTERWMLGTRFWEGWLYEHCSNFTKSIAPVVILWCAPSRERQKEKVGSARMVVHRSLKKDNREAMIRVHPSAFLQLWEELLSVCKMQKPAVMLEDLRFEIGSIEVMGPAAAEVLANTLWLRSKDKDCIGPQAAIREIWSSLHGLSNPSSLPANVVAGFEASDPRLHHPPHPAPAKLHSIDVQQHAQIVRLLANWPLDDAPHPQKLFSRSSRLAAQRALPSQKAINRRKAAAAPGAHPDPKAVDPAIPVIILPHRNVSALPDTSKSSTASHGQQGSWTILLPWKCILPVWYCLIHQPISFGGLPRFGGLEETRQITFERGGAWFPCDYPGTTAGYAWEIRERENRRQKWARYPKGRRIEYESIDLGDGKEKRKGEIGLGWACDWERLLNGDMKSTQADVEQAEGEKSTTLKIPWQLPAATALKIFKLPLSDGKPASFSTSLTTVRLQLLSRGAPSTCARIYRLPNRVLDFRTQWLTHSPSLRRKEYKTLKNNTKVSLKPPHGAPAHEQRRHLAASLLDPSAKLPPKPGEDEYPHVPGEDDLIGFVTTGGFNMGEGRGTGVGAISLGRALMLQERENSIGNEKKLNDLAKLDLRLCIVRDAGHSLGRLARWSIIT